MKVTPEQVHDLLEFVESIGGGTDPGERRCLARVLTQVRIEVVRPPDQPAEAFLATLLDVSQEGLGIQCERSLSVGERFVVNLPSDNKRVRLLCTVVNKHASAVGSRIGARFDEIEAQEAKGQ
jgi:hypothetical protein